MTFDYGNIKQGWVLILSSSLLCLLGCFIIFVDDLYKLILPKSFVKKHPFKLKEDFGFLICSLSFSSGCLIFTALNRLLLKSKEYLVASSLNEKLVQRYWVFSFLFGLLVYFLLDAILHLITSESVIHHSHDLESNENGHHATPDNYDESEIIRSETSPLIPKKKFSFIHIFSNESVGECKGYSSAEACVNDIKKLHYCELPISIKGDTDLLNSEVHSIHSHEHEHDHNHDHEHHHTHDHYHGRSDNHSYVEDNFDIEEGNLSRQKSRISLASDHHHHISTPLSRLLMIGIQTTLAITLHKLPEGFITFVTSEADSKLGIEIFLSLLVHNFIEGFSMCLPFYYLFSNSNASSYPKLKSILIGGGLGFISQPLGGLLGLLFLSYTNYNLKDLNFVFGLTMAITSGFLTVVALSMFGSATAFNGRLLSMVTLWTLVGMGVICISSLLH